MGFVGESPSVPADELDFSAVVMGEKIDLFSVSDGKRFTWVVVGVCKAADS